MGLLLYPAVVDTVAVTVALVALHLLPGFAKWSVQGGWQIPPPGVRLSVFWFHRFMNGVTGDLFWQVGCSGRSCILGWPNV